MQDKWTNQLNSILSDYEVTPPEGLWESLGEVLPASDVSSKSDSSASGVPVKRVSSRRWHRAVNIAAMIALLLSVGSGVWWLMQDDTISLDPQAAITSTVTPKLSSPPVGVEAVSKSVPAVAQAFTSAATPPSHPVESAQQNVAEVEDNPSVTENSTDSIAEASNPNLSLSHTHDSNTHESYSGYGAHPNRAATASSRLSIGLLTAYAGDRSSSAYSFIYGPPGDPNSNAPELPPIEEITDTHHDPPVRVGLTVQYPVTDRFSLESGLMYTFLSSKQSVIVPDVKLTESAYRLHYLGIPLTVKYRLNRASFHGFDAYLSAGGALEKCISGKERTTNFISNSPTTTTAPCGEHPWQWSLTAAAGLQYRPIPSFGIYLEPGLTYYIPASTSLPVIYRDRPLQFNLTLGLRFLLPR